jgi:type II secretory pathway pseudopilin PulG
MVAGRGRERGFTLVEAMVATVLATVAVLGLAYTFSLGRGFINRYEIARSALTVAESRLDQLHGNTSSSDFSTDSTHVRPFNHGGREIGLEEWTVVWFNDPATPNTQDLKRVTVIVSWTMGNQPDTVRLTRMFLPQSP